MSDNYGDAYETPIIVIMAAAIILSLVGIVALNKAFNYDCTHSDYTYCEPHH